MSHNLFESSLTVSVMSYKESRREKVALLACKKCRNFWCLNSSVRDYYKLHISVAMQGKADGCSLCTLLCDLVELEPGVDSVDGNGYFQRDNMSTYNLEISYSSKAWPTNFGKLNKPGLNSRVLF